MMNYVILLILIAIFLLLSSGIVKQIKKAGLLKKARLHLNNAPAFSADLIDCYVKFHGRVALPNQYTTPLLHNHCVLYQTKVFAEWKTKLKKPQRGMTTNRKTLYSNQSDNAQPLALLANDGRTVHLNFNDFDQTGHVIELSSDKFKSPRCPEVCSEQAQSKYTHYLSAEKWLESDAAVMIYGKLEKNTQGQFTLTPTGRGDYPTVFKVNSKSGRKLDAEINKKLFLTRFGIFLRIIILLGFGYALLEWLKVILSGF